MLYQLSYRGIDTHSRLALSYPHWGRFGKILFAKLCAFA
ncbi:hypothetical protein CHELA1G11_14262 [Hyphomicrobiales bacterium]|nr:hypothetical protein CHELA1G2_10051 [Hyphomicrobiales bacterium]CAH1677367.1 hypothetical protein CHELA1G11_14262 [Hyphomicrobiales bacterium]